MHTRMISFLTCCHRSRLAVLGLALFGSLILLSVPAAATDQVRLVKQTLKIKKFDLEYPQLQGLPDQVIQQRLNARLKRVATDFAAQYKRDAGAQGEVIYEVQRRRGDILSVLFTASAYTGGAHPLPALMGLTANLRTGEVYRLADLFRQEASWRQTISRLIREEFARRQAREELSLLRPFTEVAPDQDFYLTNDQLVIFFQVYDYTPYADGFPEFDLPLATLQALLIPELGG